MPGRSSNPLNLDNQLKEHLLPVAFELLAYLGANLPDHLPFLPITIAFWLSRSTNRRVDVQHAILAFFVGLHLCCDRYGISSVSMSCRLPRSSQRRCPFIVLGNLLVGKY